jgi:hypothetical protein
MATLVDLSNWLQTLPDELEVRQEELQAAADGQVKRIEQRTAQGVGYDLQIFAPYAPATKKDAPVNLHNSGDMLDSITVHANRDEAHIFFADPKQEQKAIWQQDGTSRIPARPFFGVGLQDRDEIMGDIRQSLFRRVNSHA